MDIVTTFYTDDETQLAWDALGYEEGKALVALYGALKKETGRVSDETYLAEVRKLRETRGDRRRQLLEILRQRYPGREPPTSLASIEWHSYIPSLLVVSVVLLVACLPRPKAEKPETACAAPARRVARW